MQLLDFVKCWSLQQYSKEPPSFHIDIVNWLENQIKSDYKKMALLAFRGAGKSTIAGLLCVWLLVKNPNIRILIMSAEQSLCEKMVAFAREVIEQHPYAAKLKPDKPINWSSHNITVKRDRSLRDPSITAKSITSNYTGCRAEVVIFDDIEVPNTCSTHKKRVSLREKIADANYVLFGDKIQIYIGTPHHEESIYLGKKAVLDSDFNVKKIPLLDKDGSIIWDGFINSKQLSAIRDTMRFRSQMMLEPVVEKSRININKIKHYSGSIVHNDIFSTIEGRELKFICGWLDLAYGKSSNNDRTAIAIVAKDIDSNFYVHDLCYLEIDALLHEDEATSVCIQAINVLSKYNVHQIRVETNGLGKFMPSTLRAVAKKRKYCISVIPIHQAVNKDARIANALDWSIATGKLYMHTRLSSSEIMDELRYWIPGGQSRDDGIDAISSCILSMSGTDLLS